MSDTNTIEHTDDEYLEAISQGVMAVPGVSGNGHAAIEVAKSVLKWLRQRGLVPRPDPRKVIAKAMLTYSGKTTAHQVTEVEAINMAAQIDVSLYYAGYVIVPREKG